MDLYDLGYIQCMCPNRLSEHLSYYLYVYDCAGSSLLHVDFTLVAGRGLLIAVASLVAEHRL